MADIIVDGKTRVAYVPTIANIAAPTTTELNAGTLLQSTLIPAGLEGFENSTAEVDNTSPADRPTGSNLAPARAQDASSCNARRREVSSRNPAPLSAVKTATPAS